MPKRSSYEIKRQILFYVKETPATYAELERKVNTGFRTVKANCEELEEFGTVKISSVQKHAANGRPAKIVSITDSGRRILKRGDKHA